MACNDPPAAPIAPPVTPPSQTIHARDPRAVLLLRAVLAALVLNGLLSFENVWPTPLIKPDHRLAPEFVMLWVVLLAIVAWRGRLDRWPLRLLTISYLALVLGRYMDVSVPALFGRQLNLYWDGHQIPRFLSVAFQQFAGWQLALIATAIVAGAWLMARLVSWAIATLATQVAPGASRSVAALALTGLAVAAVAANLMHVQATWPYLSKPVLPTYLRQVDLLITAFSPQRLARLLPESPPFAGNLQVLNGADVKVLFLESYGAITYDIDSVREAVTPSRERFAAKVAGTGRRVVSAFVTAPTFAGASELAHLTLLSGIDLTDPMRHDVLLTTERPTLIDHFRRHGYRTIGLYPALSWDWAEKSFYGFDDFLDGRDLDYRGPHFGLWWIPDQFTVARFEQRFSDGRDPRPQFMLLPTITSHIPFRPVPPYQPDWQRVLGPHPFDDADTQRAMADEIDWTDLREPYIGTMQYTFRWLTDYLDQPQLDGDLLVILGDHQPASSVSGPGASWDVPVHVVSDNPRVLERLLATGFTEGVRPDRRSLGTMNRLTSLLLQAFDEQHRPGPPMVLAR